MIPFPIEIVVLPLVSLITALIAAPAIAYHLTRPARALRRNASLLRPVACIFLGVLALIACFVTSWATLAIAYSLMTYPPPRIEPANFAGGPSNGQVALANTLAAVAALAVAIGIWLPAFSFAAKR